VLAVVLQTAGHTKYPQQTRSMREQARLWVDVWAICTFRERRRKDLGLWQGMRKTILTRNGKEILCFYRQSFNENICVALK
jgi:hypothetical protein